MPLSKNLPLSESKFALRRLPAGFSGWVNFKRLKILHLRAGDRLTAQIPIHYSRIVAETTFVEVCLETAVDSGELLAMLQDCGVLGSWEADGVLHIFWSGERWNPAVQEALKRALAALKIPDAGLIVKMVPDRDWNADWVAALHPVRIGRRVRIRQSWHPGDSTFKGIELIVDPKRAFGSGYHETTQLVIEWLEDHLRGGDQVLDIGTGSGILAMTAIRLGAATALGIDNDSVALECAKELAAINGFGSELELRMASFEQIGSEEFDVVLANLDGKTLVMLCPFLPALLKSGGLACFSGMQQQDLEGIADALGKASFRINARTERGDWLALEVRKME